MKQLVLLLVLAIGVLLVESRAVIDEDVENQCMEDQDLDQDQMKATLTVSTTAEDDEMYGKFYVCVWKGRGAMKEDGSLDSDAFKKFLVELLTSQPFQSDEVRDKIINNIVERCKEEKGETEGATAIKLKNCMVRVVNQMVKNKTADI